MITFHAVTFGYGQKPLFKDLDLDLEPGCIYGLLGLNGAGKTSFLKLAAGALRPQSGDISVFGSDPSKRSASGLADLCFVPDDPWLPAVKPADWVKRYACFRPAFDSARFDRLIDELVLDRDKILTKYSFGQRKKFALAAAIASGAHALLLDEPTNGLDIPSKGQLRRILAESADPGRVVLVSTHQVRDLENILDPVIIVHGGRVLFKLGADELSDKLSARHLSSLEGEPVIYAERDAIGWSGLLAAPASNAAQSEGKGTAAQEGGLVSPDAASQAEDGDAAARTGGTGAPDLELVFDAAIAAPERLELALSGEPDALARLTGSYKPEEHEIAKEAAE